METILNQVASGAEFTLLPKVKGFRAILAFPGMGSQCGKVFRHDDTTPQRAVAGIVAQLMTVKP